MHYENAQKEIMKVMRSMARKYSLHNVFRDFTTLAACTISNSVDKQQWEKREEMYMRTIKKYEKDEANNFANMLALVSMGLDDRLGDFMGELYMELEISNKNSGQFFTPFDVSKMMTQLIYDPNVEKLKTNRIIDLNEPAVGSGGMIVAFADAMKSDGFNYQKQLKVVCNDVDYDVVKMCYIQLSLIGIDAVVMQGNTLTLEFNEVWHTPMHVLNKVKELEEQRTKSMVDRMNDIIKQPEKEVVEMVPGQMDIFEILGAG